MRLTRILASATACLLGANLATAQELHFNEIFASHTGSDDSEYIELIGTPNMSLDGWMVVIVEGDGLAAGILDRAWDLTTYTMPADGYFVLGDAAVLSADYDLALGPHGGGATDNIENGSQTYYLIETNDATFVEGLHNKDLDLDDDLITLLAQFPGTITIHEVVGVFDEDGPWVTEEVYDGALELGPDLAGPYEPAGVFRPDDYPSCWCADEWLDFFLAGLTPGSMNPSSGCTLSTDCAGTGGPVGSSYCGPASLNSSGMSGLITGFGTDVVADNFLELTGTQLPMNQFSMFIASQTQGFVNPPGSSGFLCISGNIGRYNASILNTGAGGTVMLSIDLNNVPVNPPTGVLPGDTWNWQLWFRDLGPTSNFTDGLTITFQ